MRHSAPILGFAFRRDGKALVSVGEDGVARIWDTATGSEIGPPLELEDDPAAPGWSGPDSARRRPACWGRSMTGGGSPSGTSTIAGAWRPPRRALPGAGSATSPSRILET